jgi:hypothetical protein
MNRQTQESEARIHALYPDGSYQRVRSTQQDEDLGLGSRVLDGRLWVNYPNWPALDGYQLCLQLLDKQPDCESFRIETRIDGKVLLWRDLDWKYFDLPSEKP